MKNKINLPGFNVETTHYGRENYNLFPKLDTSYGHSVIPQEKKEPHKVVIPRSCLNNYLECQLSCQELYPESADGGIGSTRLNHMQRQACLNGCDNGFDSCL